MRNVRQNGRVWIVFAEAPKGYVWKASGTHEYIASTWYTRPSAADRDKELEECFRLGVEPCSEIDCEWCQESE